MKKLSSFALGLSLLSLASCSSDEPQINGGGNQNSGEKDTYATITISLPTGSRSRAIYDDDEDPGIYTGDGQEIGQDFENQVGQILVVLATQDAPDKYSLLTYALSDAMSVTGNPGEVEYVLNFSSKELRPEIADDKLNGAGNLSGKNVYVFAYCNPTKALIDASKTWAKGTDISNLEGQIAALSTDTEIWQKNHFLMTNVKYQKANDIPTRDELVSKHNTTNTAFDLGTVYVERAVARFDFQATNDPDLELNQYSVENTNGGDRIGIVEFTDMAVFNISKTYYYLPRTNAQWSWTGQTTICSGKDNKTNAFVMSTNEAIKKSTTLTEAALNGIFFAALNNESAYRWQTLKDWNTRTSDYDEGWTPGAGTDYRIWRYVTENTIPQWGENTYGSQRAGITTGVCFKASFIPTDTELWNGNAIYVFNNTVYGDFNALKTYVQSAENTDVAAAFKQVQEFDIENPTAKQLKENLVANAEDAHGFSAYVPNEDGGYEMYYYYYNRHISNNNNTTLGVNEFGVVRNNVYKLKVTKVNSLGLPTPPDPNTEDEEEQIFFTVNVEVLPWVVRVNDIEF